MKPVKMKLGLSFVFAVLTLVSLEPQALAFSAAKSVVNTVFRAPSSSTPPVAVHPVPLSSPVPQFGPGNVYIDPYELTCDGWPNASAEMCKALTELHNQNTQLQGSVQQLVAQNQQLQGSLASALSQISALSSANQGLQNTVASLSAKTAPIGVATLDGQPALTIDGVNVYIRNGSGFTTTANARGNLVLGYNLPNNPASARTGSHNVIIGDENGYAATQGLIVGAVNTIQAGADYATAIGLNHQILSGGINGAALGGNGNKVLATNGTVVGGNNNQAQGFLSTVAGGAGNVASGQYSGVYGGVGNAATYYYNSVHGGGSNKAQGIGDSITGGNSVSTSATGSYQWAAGSLHSP